MTLLLHCGPVPETRLRFALYEHLAEMPIRVWPHLGNCEDICLALVSRIPEGELAKLPNLRLVGSLHAGVDHLLRADGVPPGIPLTRPVPPHGDRLMSEYVLAQVMSLHRSFPAYAKSQESAHWEKLEILPTSERSVGFLGFGAMAAPAARLVRDVGFRVGAWVRRPRHAADIPLFHGENGLKAMLAQSSIVVNLLPLTDLTVGLIDAGFLGQMQRGSAFVNVGRGDHVVDRDLLAALDSGHLSHAVLDVFRTEPLPAESPFWRHARITVTPHACRVVDVQAVVAQFAQEARRVLSGNRPHHAVDRTAGY